MAIDKGKFQEDEEEASAVARFHKIVLGWDYKQLAKENEVSNSPTFLVFWFLFLICYLIGTFSNVINREKTGRILKGS